jgi:dipeptidyl aminopeptidase/acylaminoacyl peptidase
MSLFRVIGLLTAAMLCASGAGHAYAQDPSNPISAQTVNVAGRYGVGAFQSGSGDAARPLERVVVEGAREFTPLEDYLRAPSIASPALSRNGQYFAVTAPVKGRMNLVVIDVKTRNATAITNFTDFDVINVNWVGNDRLVFSLGQFNSPTGPGNFDGGGLFVLTKDGKDGRKISPTLREVRASNQRVLRGYSLYRTLPDTDQEIIATGNMRSAESDDLYRLNIITGRASLITTDRPERTFDWVLDRNLVPRVVKSALKDESTTVVHYRKDEKSPWQEIARYDTTKGPVIDPLTFDDDNQTLQVASNKGRDTMAIFKFDPNTKQLGELIAQHPRFDIGANAAGGTVPGVRTDWKTGKIVGFSVQADRPQTVWTDPEYQRRQQMIDAALPGTHNTFAPTPDGKRLLVTAFSDRQPRRWYFLDEEAKTLEEVLSSQSWLGPEKLVEQRSFILKTRDGLEIPSYYFLPKDYKPGTRLPTIIHIHGGPAVRADTWGDGFGYREGQIFASRGYAVIVPNFRITPGLGSKVYYSGFGSIGRQMSDDHEDAVKWGIEQGFVDPARVCMSGGSYGGYATLMAIARNSNMFKCGISGLMVSDWKLLVTSLSGDTNSDGSVKTILSWVGANDLDSETVRSVSPAFFAEKIKAPLFVYAGRDDIRTPLEQTRKMVDALNKAGSPPKAVVIKPEEGHGYGKFENRVDLYTQIFKFLDEHLQGKK